jgi:hypothetical protein
MPVVSEIKEAYEKVVGHRVPKSTIYGIVARHGWRKIAPRSHHPKGDLLLQGEIKKILRTWIYGNIERNSIGSLKHETL